MEKNICESFIRNRGVDPRTGNQITINSPEYIELSNLCHQYIPRQSPIEIKRTIGTISRPRINLPPISSPSPKLPTSSSKLLIPSSKLPTPSPKLPIPTTKSLTSSPNIVNPIHRKSIKQSDGKLQSFKDLPNDMIIKIALNMDIGEIYNFCQIDTNFNKIICDNDYFWKQKYDRDFGKNMKSDM